MDDIKILFLGDHSVGKTSMIRTLLTHSFPAHVPSITPRAILRAAPPLSQFTLIDSSIDVWDSDLPSFSLIVLVYDLTRPETQHRVLSHWLPRVQQHPVIIVGNKKDLPHMCQKSEEFAQTVLAQFATCYICVETSATSYFSLSFLLQLA